MGGQQGPPRKETSGLEGQQRHRGGNAPENAQDSVHTVGLNSIDSKEELEGGGGGLLGLGLMSVKLQSFVAHPLWPGLPSWPVVAAVATPKTREGEGKAGSPSRPLQAQ